MGWLSHIWKKPFLQAPQVPVRTSQPPRYALARSDQSVTLTIMPAMPPGPDPVPNLPLLGALADSRNAADELMAGRHRAISSFTISNHSDQTHALSNR